MSVETQVQPQKSTNGRSFNAEYQLLHQRAEQLRAERIALAAFGLFAPRLAEARAADLFGTPDPVRSRSRPRARERGSPRRLPRCGLELVHPP